jgi:hypothetical protein
MLVVQGLGVQLVKVNGMGQTSSVFVYRSRIRDVVINEGISACRVLFYLAFIVSEQDDMVMAFQVRVDAAGCCAILDGRPSRPPAALLPAPGHPCARLPYRSERDPWRRRPALLTRSADAHAHSLSHARHRDASLAMVA